MNPILKLRLVQLVTVFAWFLTGLLSLRLIELSYIKYWMTMLVVTALTLIILLTCEVKITRIERKKKAEKR